MAGKEDWLANGLPVEGEATVDRAGDHAEAAATCMLHETVSAARERVKTTGVSVCVVVNEEGVVAGVLDQRRLDADADAVAAEVMQTGPTAYRPGVGAHELRHRLEDTGDAAAILTTNDGRLVGLFRSAEVRH